MRRQIRNRKGCRLAVDLKGNGCILQKTLTGVHDQDNCHIFLRVVAAVFNINAGVSAEGSESKPFQLYGVVLLRRNIRNPRRARRRRVGWLNALAARVSGGSGGRVVCAASRGFITVFGVWSSLLRCVAVSRRTRFRFRRRSRLGGGSAFLYCRRRILRLTSDKKQNKEQQKNRKSRFIFQNSVLYIFALFCIFMPIMVDYMLIVNNNPKNIYSQ